jgi:hypothetical protein
VTDSESNTVITVIGIAFSVLVLLVFGAAYFYVANAPEKIVNYCPYNETQVSCRPGCYSALGIVYGSPDVTDTEQVAFYQTCVLNCPSIVAGGVQ